MSRLRTYSAWFLLLAAVMFAAPRTWIHACDASTEQHIGHAEEGDHEEVAHGTCSLCDLAVTSSLEPVAPMVFLSSSPVAVEEQPVTAAAIATPYKLADPRGPPTA